jgi:hypothetical protein
MSEDKRREQLDKISPSKSVSRRLFIQTSGMTEKEFEAWVKEKLGKGK